MRIGLAFTVLVYAVLLALPETWGAPSCDCSDEVDKGNTISESKEKSSSKNSERLATEDEERKKTEAKASNGLVSGSSSVSMSRSLTDKDEENSDSKDEKVTTTGSAKTSESVNKKKLVSVDETKKVLIYYMVSYKKLPKRGEEEDLNTYYKRVFPVEENLYVFYRKIFKSYEGEKPAGYITRVEYIFDNVYPDKDCRLDLKYLELFDHYYTIKYSRKVDETDACYYPRILAKLTGESNEHYNKRMKCLVEALDEEDFTHITFDNSFCGYKIGVKKNPTKKKTSTDSTDGVTPRAKMTSSTKKSKQEEVDVDEDESSKNEKNAQGTTSESAKSLKKKKTTVEKEENVKTFEYRVAYTKLPNKKPGELDAVYYKRFFGEFTPTMSETARNELYLRILIQYKGENMTAYVERIDYLFDKCYPKWDIRTNRLVIGLLDHYYREKYQKHSCETEDQWFARVLTKLPKEEVQHYKDRVYCLKTVFTEVKWARVKIDASSTTGYSLVTC